MSSQLMLAHRVKWIEAPIYGNDILCAVISQRMALKLQFWLYHVIVIERTIYLTFTEYRVIPYTHMWKFSPGEYFRQFCHQLSWA